MTDLSSDLKKLLRHQGFKDLVTRFSDLKLKGVRVSTKTGSRVEARLQSAGRTVTVRFDTRYLLNMGELGEDGVMARSVAQQMIAGLGALDANVPRVQDWLVKCTGDSWDSPAVLLMGILGESPAVAEALRAVRAFVDSGAPVERERRHNREMALEEARKSLRTAFRNGTTRDEAIDLVDMILVSEVMDR